MRQHSAEALLLDVVDLHEGDRIATFLTAEYGKKRGVARGARRKYSRFAGQLQPLAKLRIGWFEKDGRDLVRIQDAEVLRSAHTLQADLESILLGSYLAEHLVVFAQENEPSPLLYRLLDSILDALRQGVDRDLAARYFEAWVLRLAGIFPPPRECPSCGSPFAAAVLPAHGEGLLCTACADGGLRIESATLDLLNRISREGLLALSATPPASPAVHQVEELCGRVRRAFLNRELRSYEVMRRTLLEVASGEQRS